MIFLKKIEIKNFLPVKDASIDFEDLDDMTLVQGKNGTGKSAIFVDAVIWCLFGQMPRGSCSPITLKEESTQVTISFSAYDKPVVVSRKAKEGSPSIKVTIDGDEVEGRKKVQEHEIGMSMVEPSLFEPITVLSQGFANRFTSLSSTDKGKFLEILASASIFQVGETKAKLEYKRCTTRLNEASNQKNLTSSLKAHAEEQLIGITRELEPAKELSENTSILA